MARKKIIKRKPKVLVIKKERKPKIHIKPGKPTTMTVKAVPTPTPTIEKAVPPAPVRFDGAEVVAILAVGETAKHCQMSDGTSKWIPKSVFNE